MLVSLASLTAIGVEGAVLLCVSRALTLAGVLAVAAMIEARVHTSRFDRLGGIVRELPAFSVFAGALFFAAGLGGGTLPLLGFFATVTGALPTLRWAAFAVPVVGLFGTLAYARAFTRVFLGEFPSSWKKSRFLEAHGGKLPLLDERELGLLVGVAGLVILLGFWPAPLARVIDSSALDQAEYANPPGALEIVQTEPDSSTRVASR